MNHRFCRNTFVLKSLPLLLVAGLYACDDEGNTLTCGEGTTLSEDGKSCEAELTAGIGVTAGETAITCGDGTTFDEESNSCITTSQVGGSEANQIVCGEGTVLDANTNACVLDDESRLILDNFSIGEFEFISPDIPEQLSGLERDQRTFTIKNVGDSDQDVVMVQVTISPVEASCDEVQSRIDSNDITDENPLIRYPVSTVFIDNLAAGEAREITYEYLLESEIEDGFYCPIFSVNEFSFVKNLDGTYSFDYSKSNMQGVDLHLTERLDDAALVKALEEHIIVGQIEHPNLRILETVIENWSFTIPQELEPGMPHEDFVVHMALSSQGKDYLGPIDITGVLKLPGYERNPLHISSVPDEIAEDPEALANIEGLTYEPEDEFIYNPERSFTLQFVHSETKNYTDNYTINPDCSALDAVTDAEFLCPTIDNDKKHIVELHARLSDESLNLLRDTLKYPELNQDLNEFAEIQGELVLFVMGGIEEYQNTYDDNEETIVVSFMAPELETLTDNAQVRGISPPDKTSPNIDKTFKTPSNPFLSINESGFKHVLKRQFVPGRKTIPVNYDFEGLLAIDISYLGIRKKLMGYEFNTFLGFDRNDYANPQNRQTMNFYLNWPGTLPTGADTANYVHSLLRMYAQELSPGIFCISELQSMANKSVWNCNFFELSVASNTDRNDVEFRRRQNPEDRAAAREKLRNSVKNQKARGLIDPIGIDYIFGTFFGITIKGSIGIGGSASLGVAGGVKIEKEISDTNPNYQDVSAHPNIGINVGYAVTLEVKAGPAMGPLGVGFGANIDLVKIGAELLNGPYLKLSTRTDAVSRGTPQTGCITGFEYLPLGYIEGTVRFLSGSLFFYIDYVLGTYTQNFLTWSGFDWTIFKRSLGSSNDIEVKPIVNQDDFLGYGGQTCLEDRPDYEGLGRLKCAPTSCQVMNPPLVDGEETWGINARDTSAARSRISNHREIYTMPASGCVLFSIEYDTGVDYIEQNKFKRNYYILSSLTPNEAERTPTYWPQGNFRDIPEYRNTDMSSAWVSRSQACIDIGNDPNLDSLERSALRVSNKCHLLGTEQIQVKEQNERACNSLGGRLENKDHFNWTTGKFGSFCVGYHEDPKVFEDKYHRTGSIQYSMYANGDIVNWEHWLMLNAPHWCIIKNDLCPWWGKWAYSHVDRADLARKLRESDFANSQYWNRFIDYFYQKYYSTYYWSNYWTNYWRSRYSSYVSFADLTLRDQNTMLDAATIMAAQHLQRWYKDSHPQWSDDIDFESGYRYGWSGLGEAQYLLRAPAGTKFILEAIVNKKPDRLIESKANWTELSSCPPAQERP